MLLKDFGKRLPSGNKRLAGGSHPSSSSQSCCVPVPLLSQQLFVTVLEAAHDKPDVREEGQEPESVDTHGVVGVTLPALP